MPTESTGSSRAASSVTAASTCFGAAPCATRVATRRNAACSSASRARAARLSALAIAVATSSVNEARRASVSGGRGCSRLVAAAIRPHRCPSTMIGVPTDERILASRAAAESGLAASA